MTILYALAQKLDLPPAFVHAAIFAAVLLAALSVYLIIKAYRLRTQTGAESLIGAKASVLEWDGKKGRVFVQGEAWNAVSETVLSLSRDDKVHIESVEDLVLKITI